MSSGRARRRGSRRRSWSAGEVPSRRLTFVDDARHIGGASQPPQPRELSDADLSDPTTAAKYRLQLTSSGVAKALGSAGGVAAGAAAGGAAAYATFTAAVMLGTASTGAAISGLSGAAATNAALAVLGGGTVARVSPEALVGHE